MAVVAGSSASGGPARWSAADAVGAHRQRFALGFEDRETVGGQTSQGVGDGPVGQVKRVADLADPGAVGRLGEVGDDPPVAAQAPLVDIVEGEQQAADRQAEADREGGESGWTEQA